MKMVVHRLITVLENMVNGKLTDGNLTIFWESGKTDYFFNGVMGYQRIRKNKNESYTSGLRKLSD